jgi:(1->4)-alpha-D-glucan 1-alpha-D-glucosylmutase
VSDPSRSTQPATPSTLPDTGPPSGPPGPGIVPPGPPLSTYRVQLTPDFGFAELADLAPYLASLGVGHVYLSPILQSVPESRHGYDVTDHSRIRAEFGGMAGLRAAAATLAGHGLGLIVDIVPNHMTVPVPESGNAALWSVLKDGPASPHASWFDIDWVSGKVNMPVLGGPPEPYADGDVLRYHDHEFPLPDTHYRLVDWRDGPGYRRFFDVSSLIGLRVEDPEVFAATHHVILGLVRDGVVQGLRVDHPDGLADPRGYLARLRTESGGVWTVAEKILVGAERLPADWACDGTTGYDALNRITRLFVDPEGAERLIDVFVRQTGVDPDYAVVVHQGKRHVLDLFFGAEIDRLVRALDLPGDQGVVRAAVVELLAALPVYRAYVVPGEPPPLTSIGLVEEAARRAAARLYGAARDAVQVVADRVLYGPAEAVVRFQQTCGPVMAKGVEDTALYRWHPLACLNEVGGEPDHFGIDVEAFHAYCHTQAPHSMTTLSTHDTKRSEDVRARLAVLSEVPEEWDLAVADWSARVSFDPPLDHLAWQNLMAAWPISVERFTDYLYKAAREAKTAISWLDPDPAYEQGIRDFAKRAIDECGPAVAEFTARIDPHAMVNSLGQKLVQLLMPGVPDVYQGNEITDFSLVDPDNRRPVDFAHRQDLLDAVTAVTAEWHPPVTGAGQGHRAGHVAAMSEGGHSGRDGTVEPSDGGTDLARWDAAKMLVTMTALRLRRRLDPAAPYLPLIAEGDAAEHAVAFARGDQAVAVVTRLPVRLKRRGGFGATTLTLPHGHFRDLLTGRPYTGRVPLAHLLAHHPVALLAKEPSPEV